MTIDTTNERRTAALHRIAPLAGVLFAGLTFGGDLIIDEFPDGSTPADQLPGYYAAHGAHVALGGTLMGWGALFFAVFGVSVWARIRRSTVPAVVAGVVFLGVAIDTASDLTSGDVYRLLGQIGVDPHVSTSALQAWHIWGSEFGTTGGMTLFLVGIAVAGIAYRAVPRWLAWTGLLVAVTQFTPVSFLGTMVFLLWAAVAGVALAIRPGVPAERTRESVAVG